ncbi:MAG: hypothetical protein ACOX3Q_05435 [Clostridia bacterium]|jgi:hypothetical protein|nr:hypothetical protein [Clostridiaceae bacterium]
MKRKNKRISFLLAVIMALILMLPLLVFSINGDCEEITVEEAMKALKVKKYALCHSNRCLLYLPRGG